MLVSSTSMKARYRIFKVRDRGNTFYVRDTQAKPGTLDPNGKPVRVRWSLETKDLYHARRLVAALNEAHYLPAASRKVGFAYLSTVSPEFATRTWQTVFDEIIKDKKGSNLHRYLTALKDPALNSLRAMLLVETKAEDFHRVLRAGKVATNVYLRRFQNYAVDMGWLPVAVLPRKLFPKVKHKQKRGITHEEHRRIIERETNTERRDFYELLWHFGGSQTDIARLTSNEIDYVNRTFCYARAKTNVIGGMRIGPTAWEIIERLPKAGPLFPYLATVRECDRATEFKQRCLGLGIHGITLHCYRYSWAERSVAAGVPERYAQKALGQRSAAVHRAYAKHSQAQLPSLEEYEALRMKEQSNCGILTFPKVVSS